MNGAAPEPSADCAAEDKWRAGTYRLLATLLAASPAQDTLDRLASIIDSRDQPIQDGIQGAWQALAIAAAASDSPAITDEYQQLFIGIGRGELVPYGSWYRTGFLMERPLGELRRQLAQLGLERDENVKEPEDHLAALFEVMAILITDTDYDLKTERAFFGEHIAPWAATFFEDLENAAAARFYRLVARLGAEFVALEQECLTIDA